MSGLGVIIAASLATLLMLLALWRMDVQAARQEQDRRLRWEQEQQKFRDAFLEEARKSRGVVPDKK